MNRMNAENNFDDLFNYLNDGFIKDEKIIDSFQFSKEGFILYLNENEFNSIRKSDIVIFNHITKQYRIFKFVNEGNNEKSFQIDKIFLKIKKKIIG